MLINPWALRSHSLSPIEGYPASLRPLTQSARHSRPPDIKRRQIHAS